MANTRVIIDTDTHTESQDCIHVPDGRQSVKENYNVTTAETRNNTIITVDVVTDTVEEDIDSNEDIPATKDDGSSLEHQKPQSQVPKDKGWAWMVLLGSVIQMAIFAGIIKTSGIIFVEFQRKFSSSSSMTSLVSTVQHAVYSVSALVVMTAVVKRLTCRQLIMIGAVITATSYVVTANAEDVRLLFFSHGVLQGIGTSFMQPCAFVMVGQYFDKKRGFANSVAVSGGPIGGLIFAPLLTAMFRYYGYSGCMLILAGIFLHGFVSGALFRPPTFYTDIPRRANKESLLGEADTVTAKVNADDKLSETHLCSENNAAHATANTDNSPHTSQVKRVSPEECVLTDTESEKLLEAPSLVKKRQVGQSRFSDITNTGSTSSVHMSPLISTKEANHYSSFEVMTDSMADIPVTINTPKRKQNLEDRKHLCSRLCTSIAATFDLHILKNPMFITFELAALTLCGPTTLPTVFMVPYAIETGISRHDTATLLAVSNAVGLFSRILIGYVSDKAYFRRSAFTGVAAIVVGICAHLVRFYSTFAWLMYYSVMLGVFSGVYFSFWASIVVDYLTVARLQSCLGFTILCHGVSSSVTFAVLGYARDLSGSYVVPFHIIGCLCFVGAGLMFALPFVEKACKRRQTA